MDSCIRRNDRNSEQILSIIHFYLFYLLREQHRPPIFCAFIEELADEGFIHSFPDEDQTGTWWVSSCPWFHRESSSSFLDEPPFVGALYEFNETLDSIRIGGEILEKGIEVFGAEF